MESLFWRGAQRRWPGPPNPEHPSPRLPGSPWGRVVLGRLWPPQCQLSLPRNVGPDNRPCPGLCVLQEAVSETEGSGTRPSHRQGCGGHQEGLRQDGGCLSRDLRGLQGRVSGLCVKGVCGGREARALQRAEAGRLFEQRPSDEHGDTRLRFQRVSTAHFKPLTKPVRQAWVMFPSYRQEIKPRVSTELPTHRGPQRPVSSRQTLTPVGLCGLERQFSLETRLSTCRVPRTARPGRQGPTIPMSTEADSGSSCAQDHPAVAWPGRGPPPGLPSFTMPSGRPAGAQGCTCPEEEPEERAESFSRNSRAGPSPKPQWLRLLNRWMAQTWRPLQPTVL